MHYRARTKTDSVLGANGYTTEVDGRDRVRYFRPPVEATGMPMRYVGMGNVRFSATADAPMTSRPDSHLALRRTGSAGTDMAWPVLRLPRLDCGGAVAAARSGNAKRAHRPSTVPKRAAESPAATVSLEGKRDAAMQTVYRENEAQTDPYTPEYFIPEGGDPNPQVLGLSELHWNDGLPAGVEEVELIQRLRRRRQVEGALLKETSKEAKLKNFHMLYDLEVKERDDRERHFEKLRERRLHQIRETLEERERMRDEANRLRLEKVKGERLATLQRVIGKVEAKRATVERKALADTASKTSASAARGLYALDPIETLRRKTDLIDVYAKGGLRVAEIQHPKNAANTGKSPTRKRQLAYLSRYRQYDVRPTMLMYEEGINELEVNKIPKIQTIPQSAFIPPENHAINSLPSLYQRREATRVVDALEYVHTKIKKGDTPAETIRVLELYRATPRPQRPDTPVLELEGEVDGAEQESCILLQRLLRGRAVQNDFFDGKERCRGLIEELQAASNAKYAERSDEEKRAEEEAKLREAIVDSIATEAQGDIIYDTLDYLFHEMTRQQDIRALEALRHEAEAVRAEREAREAELRAQERILHDKEAVQYAAYVRAIEDVVECYSHDLYTTVVEECAVEEAINEECDRLEMLPSSTANITSGSQAAENLVCDILDDFVLPAVIDMVRLKPDELDRKAPAAASVEFTMSLANNERSD